MLITLIYSNLFRIPYGAYFGGVVAITPEQYKNINGHSNLYFGWGGEDDDFYTRWLSSKYKLKRYPKAIGRYDMIVHKRDSGNESNNRRKFILKSTAKKRAKVEGLSTSV